MTFPPALADSDDDGNVRLGDPLADVIEENGFGARDSKTRLQGKSDRQLVTGVVVNERLNVDRRYVRRIRAMLHNWEHHGLEEVQSKLHSRFDTKDRHPNADPDFRSVLRGRIAYLAMIRESSDPIASRFAAQFDNLISERPLNHGVDPPASIPGASAASERRRLVTMMFTDIVDSTARSAILGDRRWHQILDTHNRRVRSCLGRYGGREVKTMGDGFLATFESPTAAIKSALAIQTAMKTLDIEVRIGLHTGEVVTAADGIEGIGVAIASRVAGVAGPGEVLVSDTLKQLVMGAEFAFAERGPRDLKGVGTWELFRVLPKSNDP